MNFTLWSYHSNRPPTQKCLGAHCYASTHLSVIHLCFQKVAKICNFWKVANFCDCVNPLWGSLKWNHPQRKQWKWSRRWRLRPPALISMRPLVVLLFSMQWQGICSLLKNVLKYFQCTNIGTIRNRNVCSFVSLSSIIPFTNILGFFFRQNEPISLQNALPKSIYW